MTDLLVASPDVASTAEAVGKVCIECNVCAVATDEEAVQDQVWGVNGMCQDSVSCVSVTAVSGSRPYGI